jgi:membrane-bound serine protease (ClpP class)
LRRLAIGLLFTAVAQAVLAAPAGAGAGDDGQGGSASERGRVDVLLVSGLFDEVVVDAIEDAIDEAAGGGAQALIIQVNSRGAVVGDDRMEQLLTDVAESPVPIALWVGPARARLYGTPAQLLTVADVSGMAPGARVGHTGTLLSPPGVEVDFGDAAAQLRTDSVALSEARDLGVLRQRVTDEGIPTLTSMVNALDGYTEDGRVVDSTKEEVLDDGTVRFTTIVTVRQSSLPLIDRLFHTVASPAITYLLLLVGLILLVFEFFTAGVGVAGVVGAGAVVLACTGLVALPARGWAVGVIIASMLAFAVDVQVGIPRFWTGVGIVGTVIGSMWLFEPLPGATLRPSWITLLAGIGGTVLAFVVGMPSMVRTRFATPTIGREWLLGEVGEVVIAANPDGAVKVGVGTWRARTNRATPVAVGAPVRVVAIDGVTLEVEPLEGAALDYRERRSRSGRPKPDGENG